MAEEKRTVPCTHGTESFLTTFTEEMEHLPRGGVVINMQTLLRNLISDKFQGLHAIEQLAAEIRYIVSILAPTLAKHAKNQRPFIMFYLFDYYRMLSGFQLRPNDSGLRQELAFMVQHIFKNVAQYFKQEEVATIEGVPIYSFHDNTPGNFPHNQLFNWISKCSHNREITMVSGHPIDWHVYMVLRKLNLVNSFTGEVVEPLDFSLKAFGDKYDELPFYVGIHRLLGDKPLISPLLTPKQKKELLELAEREDWKHHSAAFVKNQVYEKYKV